MYNVMKQNTSDVQFNNLFEKCNFLKFLISFQTFKVLNSKSPDHKLLIQFQKKSLVRKTKDIQKKKLFELLLFLNR